MEGQAPHYCTGCGEIHGAKHQTPPEVEIARIQAERDIRVAELGRTETKMAVEGQLAETEIVAEATVDEAVVKAEVLDELMAPEPEPEPVVVVADETGGEPAEEIPDAEPPETEPASAGSKGSNPWW
ncbi:MAG: hypothetical protein JWO67_5380 [Streptosporangiaceae bacterium]|nr:hypothetical protein [Streptosporangiaceae bacterium]